MYGRGPDDSKMNFRFNNLHKHSGRSTSFEWCVWYGKLLSILAGRFSQSKIRFFFFMFDEDRWKGRIAWLSSKSQAQRVERWRYFMLVLSSTAEGSFDAREWNALCIWRGNFDWIWRNETFGRYFMTNRKRLFNEITNMDVHTFCYKTFLHLIPEYGHEVKNHRFARDSEMAECLFIIGGWQMMSYVNAHGLHLTHESHLIRLTEWR